MPTYHDLETSPPADVTVLLDCTAPADELEPGDSDTWTAGTAGMWNGRKNGTAIELSWFELARRFGPLTTPRE